MTDDVSAPDASSRRFVSMTPMVAVIGNGDPDEDRDRLAAEAGAAIARAGCGLVSGGLGGVMSAASRGARTVTGGTGPPIVAILPGTDKQAAHPYADVVIPTGLGEARNILVVMAADAVLAIGGESGTLSEIAHAWKLGRPLGALVDGGGWAAKLAGERIDGRRRDRVAALHDIAGLEAWLKETTGGT